MMLLFKKFLYFLVNCRFGIGQFFRIFILFGFLWLRYLQLRYRVMKAGEKFHSVSSVDWFRNKDLATLIGSGLSAAGHIEKISSPGNNEVIVGLNFVLSTKLLCDIYTFENPLVMTDRKMSKVSDLRSEVDRRKKILELYEQSWSLHSKAPDKLVLHVDCLNHEFKEGAPKLGAVQKIYVDDFSFFLSKNKEDIIKSLRAFCFLQKVKLRPTNIYIGPFSLIRYVDMLISCGINEVKLLGVDFGGPNLTSDPSMLLRGLRMSDFVPRYEVHPTANQDSLVRASLLIELVDEHYLKALGKKLVRL